MPNNGIIAMLKPKLRATRSIHPKSSLLGNNIAINEYPGRKSTKEKPRMILTGVSCKEGIETDSINNKVNRTVIVRSTLFRNFLIIFMHEVTSEFAVFIYFIDINAGINFDEVFFSKSIYIFPYFRITPHIKLRND